MDFFYDGQTRRYLVQFMRIFSDIKIRNGPDENGMYTIQRVPILYGDPSNMVAQIIKGQSENTLMPSPMMSAYIDSIKMAPNRRQDTQLVQPASTMEREFNKTTETYGSGPGVRYQVEKYMPVPYDLYLKLDIWTTNTENKLQLLEQIWTIFNPSLMLQQNSNILDWTAVFEVWLEDVTWTNRSIPQGGDVVRDVASLRFKVPIWINPPAKVTRSTLIAEIVTNVFNVSDTQAVENIIEAGYYDPFGCFGDSDIQIVTTVGNYEVSVEKAEDGIHDEITLLHPYGNVNPTLNWESLFKKYGRIVPNITNIRLKLNPDLDDTSSDVIGTIEQDPTRPNVLIFTPDIDTLPANTLPPITAIIDPMEVFPGNGLPAAVAGQRYLLTSSVSAGEEPAIPPAVITSSWGSTIVAYPNDIIQYNGSFWEVIFDSANATGKNYVINNNNKAQYLYEGNSWTYSYFGTYAPGYWRIDGIVTTPLTVCDDQQNTGITQNIYE